MKLELVNVNKVIAKVEGVENLDLRKPLLKVGNDIETAAKENCNGRFDAPTGDLKRSIRAELTSPNTVEVGTNVEYAVYVEHGTGIYAFDGKGRPASPEHPIPWTYKGSDGLFHTTYGVRPRPFLIPAFNSKKHNLIKYIKEEYDDRF